MLTVFDGHYFVLISLNRFYNQFGQVTIGPRRFELGFFEFPFIWNSETIYHGFALKSFTTRANSNYCIFLFAQEFLIAWFNCILTWLSSWVAPDLRC